MKILHWTDIHLGIVLGSDTFKMARKLIKKVSTMEFDVVLITGDIPGKKQKNIESFFKMLRLEITTPILWVKGNHCLWRGNEDKFKTYEEIISYHNELCQKYNIQYLENNPFVFNDTVICGYDGWYQNLGTDSADLDYLPLDVNGVLIDDFLSKKAYNDLNKIIDLDLNRYSTKIIATHFHHYSIGTNGSQYFGANQNELDLITEKFDYLFHGHAHHEACFSQDNCQVISCGNGYQYKNSGIISYGVYKPENIKVFIVDTNLRKYKKISLAKHKDKEIYF